MKIAHRISRQRHVTAIGTKEKKDHIIHLFFLYSAIARFQQISCHRCVKIIGRYLTGVIKSARVVIWKLSLHGAIVEEPDMAITT
jgi:hypothetical protein